jgi:hypothetical protein
MQNKAELAGGKNSTLCRQNINPKGSFFFKLPLVATAMPCNDILFFIFISINFFTQKKHLPFSSFESETHYVTSCAPIDA